MFGLRNKTPEPASDLPVGPLDRIGRRSVTEARSESASTGPVDRQARLAEAAATLSGIVGSRLRSLVREGASAGEVTRQAGLQAQSHFRSYGIVLSPLELRGYVADVVRPVLPATSFAAPETPLVPALVEPAPPAAETGESPAPAETESQP